MKACSRCQQPNPDDANYCHQCGGLVNVAVATRPQSPADMETSAPPSEEALWRDFIGPNADRYLEQFKKFSSNGRPRFALTWNWPAFLFISFLWFLYRKMYLHAFVYAVGPMVSTYLTGDFTVGIVWSTMAGATANYLYYWHCREHIAEFKRAGGLSGPARDAALKDAGGVQPYVIWVGVVLYAVFFATLAKMIQEGPPAVPPAKPAKSTAIAYEERDAGNRVQAAPPGARPRCQAIQA